MLSGTAMDRAARLCISCAQRSEDESERCQAVPSYCTHEVGALRCVAGRCVAERQQ